jgi:hypothetical protein
MPKIHRAGPFTFYVWPHDHGSPHVHVVTTEGYAKIRIQAQEVIETKGMSYREIEDARAIVYENRKDFGRKWREYHGN